MSLQTDSGGGANTDPTMLHNGISELMLDVVARVSRRLQPSTDRAVGLVDQYCTTGQVSSHSFQVGENGPYVSLVTVILSVMYLTMGFVIIYFIKIQERNARLGDSDATKSVIFPVFVTCLWINSFVNMYIGVIFFTDIFMTSVFLPVLLFAFVFCFQHMVVEGIAILLMKKGLGWDGARQSMPIIALWGVFTGLTKFLTFYQKFSANQEKYAWLVPYANALNFLWAGLLLIFYFCLWVAPQRNLFRRPAAINYAAFWFIFRLFSIICGIIGAVTPNSSHGSLGLCILEISPFFILSALEPLVVYYTLLQDSRWWQGLDIRQGRRRRDAEGIRSPLEGVDIGLGAAQALASTLDVMQDEEVRLLNFAYITLDTNGKNMLGSGSFSKVYKGAYKGEVCAVKLIFTVDLTEDVIRRVAAEAQILSRIVHVNIVKTFGVSVLPPSVCILLEFCEMGSLQDVVKGSGIFTSNGRISSRLLFSPHVHLLMPANYAVPTSASSPWLDGTGFPIRAGIKKSSAHLTTSTGSLYHVEEEESDLTFISTADRLWLALGCSAGVGALHEYNSNLCHRDIKSFNFLVDAQLRVKLADMELGQSDELEAKGTLSSNRETREGAPQPINKTNPGPFNVTSSADDCSTVNMSHSPPDAPGSNLRKSLLTKTDKPALNSNGIAQIAADVTGKALSDDAFLANWAAPEVVRGNGHTQASDIYSTSLVMWELLSAQVPFSMSGETYQTVRQDEVRRRIMLGERPELPMIPDDKFRNVVKGEADDSDVNSQVKQSRDSGPGGQIDEKTRSSTIDTEEDRNALYDGYGSGSSILRKGTLAKATPAPQHVISARSPYTALIRLIRRGWAESQSERLSARALYEEVHTIWRSVCHRLVMFVMYDPNTNSNYNCSGQSCGSLDSRFAQAKGRSGLYAYQTSYERNANGSAPFRKESTVGSTFAALVRSNSQADKAFPPLVRTGSSVGNFKPPSRANSITESKSWIGTGSPTAAADDKRSRPSLAENTSLDDTSPENFQSLLACVAADPSYIPFDTDGGAWVIVSSESPHFILRYTSAFGDMLGLTSSCVGQALVDTLDGPRVDVAQLRQFLYEMTLFNIHESVMRRQETARCTTSLYPSYYCNHALVTLYGADVSERGSHPYHSFDSAKSASSSVHANRDANKSIPTEASTFNTMHDSDLKRGSKGTGLFRFSIHAFPIFGASPGHPCNASKANMNEEGDWCDAGSAGSARSSESSRRNSVVEEVNFNPGITADMKPVAFALYFSKFKKLIDQVRRPSEGYTNALSGMVRGLGSMLPFPGKGNITPASSASPAKQQTV